MKVVHSWLQEYLPFDLSPEELAQGLSMLGLEIEGIERPGERYRGFVVGEVKERLPHPNADRLTVCVVDIGGESLRVVCGAPNVAPGQKVAVGTVGATVPRSQHDPEQKPFVLSRTAIRGVESAGMICSAYELDLGDDAAGIMVLDPGAVAGSSLAAYLGIDDVVYDVEVTANRPDWLSHLGVAREIGVLVGKAPRSPRLNLVESSEPASRCLTIRVEDPVDCPRFAARVLRGVRPGASPRWMQDRLTCAGLRPRNVIVDVTNYVMLECGQPLHAFDADRLAGATIVVRRAGSGKRFTTLDGKTCNLPPDAVMVCDADREVSIAGIMGGANSEISDATVNIVLESAYWNPAAIRRTRRALGLSTDASQRFERGADPNATDYALARAAALIQRHAGGELLRGAIDVYPRPVTARTIALRVPRVNQILGTSLSPGDVRKALTRLGLGSSGRTAMTMHFKVPTFRVDLEREIDLIEEVARVHGYDNIEVTTTARIDFDHPFPRSSPTAAVRDHLIGAGFQEAITTTLRAEEEASLGGVSPALLANPQGMEMAALRTSILPGLLEVIARNQSYGTTNLRLFEIGHVFSRDETGRPKLVEPFLEEEKLALIMTGLARPRQWGEEARPVSLFDLKGVLSTLIEKFILDKGRFISYSTPEALAGSPLSIEINGTNAGYLGSVRGDVLKRFGIEQEVFVAELNVSILATPVQRKYRQLPRFPRVKRDLAFIVDVLTPVASIESVLRIASGPLLQSVEVFDVYQGPNLPAGKKSIAFGLELMSYDRTLTDAEIEAELQRMVVAVEREFGASLRTA